MPTIIDNIKTFSNTYKMEINKGYSKDLESFKLLVKEIPNQLKTLVSSVESNNLTVKGSIGQGGNTPYPWIQIRDNRVSKGATDGFYVVFLFSDDFEDLYLTINQGSTKQKQNLQEVYREHVYTTIPNIEGFIKDKLPMHSLVKNRTYTPSITGGKYEKSNMFYKKYLISDLNEVEITKDLLQLLAKYIESADAYPNKYDTPLKPQPAQKRLREINTMEEIHSIPIKFYDSLKRANILLDPMMILRFIALLCTKPFVILTGLSGSGKTKLAQAFSRWICEDGNQTCIVPVGSDWTNREPLLGYPNALQQGEYISANGILEMIIEASNNPRKPYFLILDEMNLSHVERYFADFLSAIESEEYIQLHPDSGLWKKCSFPSMIKIPKNLFIIGTVNIDETTYMFSPKVLDRAGVVEFRVSQEDMGEFLNSPGKPDLKQLEKKGSSIAEDFVNLAMEDIDPSKVENLKDDLLKFFTELKKTGAEFGYRTASDIYRFAGLVNMLNSDDEKWTKDQIADAAIIQKLLPKLHGSRKKLEPVLKTLAGFCLAETDSTEIEWDKIWREGITPDLEVRYPLSLEKIIRMYNRVIQDGFTSFAEA